jgi:hypothetical protein
MNHHFSLSGQVGNGHNRCHPHIKPRIRIASGTQVEIEALDGFDGRSVRASITL